MSAQLGATSRSGVERTARDVIALRPGFQEPSDDELSAYCHERISGYKVPRTWIRRDRLQRLPTGKADYRWAADTATRAAADGPDVGDLPAPILAAPWPMKSRDGSG